MPKCNDPHCRVHNADSLNAHFFAIIVGRWPQMADAMENIFIDKFASVFALYEQLAWADGLRTMILACAMNMTVEFADEVELHLQNPKQFAWYTNGATLMNALTEREVSGKKINLGEDGILNAFTEYLIEVIQAVEHELAMHRAADLMVMRDTTNHTTH